MFVLLLKSIESQLPSSTSEKISANMFIVKVIFLGWLVELFFKGLTIVMAQSLFKDHQLNIPECISDVTKKFIRLLMATGVILLPLMIIVKTALDVEGNITSGLLGLGMFLLVIPATLILEFIPIMVLIEKRPVFKAIKDSAVFVKQNLYAVIVFTSLSFAILFSTFIFSAMFIQVPVLGESIFQAVINGLGYAFVYVMTVVFYYEITNPKSVETIA